MVEIFPFFGANYVINGFGYLGLPGFSGFVAEMNIFVGAFQQNSDTFNRVLTILVVSTIVVTSVYILRLVGKIMMGPLETNDVNDLPKATWFEKTGILLLMIPVVGIGVAPYWLSDMIMKSLEPFIQGVL